MRTPPQPRRARLLVVAVLVSAPLGLALSGCATGAIATPAAAPTSTGAVERWPSASAAPTPSTPVPVAPTAPPVPVVDAGIASLSVPAVVAPVRLVVDGLPIDMAVEPMGVDDDDLMALPPDTAVAGWYRFGPGLDAAEGTTVIAAHVDSNAYGLGPFAELKNAAPGTTVRVQGADGAERDYRVTEVETTVKGDVPLGEVFARSGAPRLVLVTCGGDFDYDTRHYLSNVVVTAEPLP